MVFVVVLIDIPLGTRGLRLHKVEETIWMADW